MVGKIFHFCGTLAPFLPVSVSSYFDFSEKKPPWDPMYLSQTTLFDILRKNNIEWLFIGAPGNNLKSRIILRTFHQNISQKISFLWLHFGELDWICHKYGPGSSETWKILTEIDSAIYQIVKVLKKTFKDVDILVFGDHGMVRTRNTVNLEYRLKKTKLKIIKDYLFFSGATMCRFWYNTENVGSKINDMLTQINYGKILENKDLEYYGCNFNDPKYGKIIWATNEGTIISPNFYNGTNIPKGMHGFIPKTMDSYASFIIKSSLINKPRRLENPIMLVDIFPTILNMMNLSAPISSKGKNIFNFL